MVTIGLMNTKPLFLVTVISILVFFVLGTDDYDVLKEHNLMKRSCFKSSDGSKTSCESNPMAGIDLNKIPEEVNPHKTLVTKKGKSKGQKVRASYDIFSAATNAGKSKRVKKRESYKGKYGRLRRQRLWH